VSPGHIALPGPAGGTSVSAARPLRRAGALMRQHARPPHLPAHCGRRWGEPRVAQCMCREASRELPPRSVRGIDEERVAGDGVLASSTSAIGWLREGQERLQLSIAALHDAELLRPRMANWGELKETRWIISIMIQHDCYHAGEITVCAPCASKLIGGRTPRVRREAWAQPARRVDALYRAPSPPGG